jgi:hypothetical protein
MNSRGRIESMGDVFGNLRETPESLVYLRVTATRQHRGSHRVMEAMPGMPGVVTQRMARGFGVVAIRSRMGMAISKL